MKTDGWKEYFLRIGDRGKLCVCERGTFSIPLKIIDAFSSPLHHVGPACLEQTLVSGVRDDCRRIVV